MINMDIEKEIARSIQNSVNKANLKDVLSSISNSEITIDKTRYLFIMGIRHDGSVYFHGHGEISEIEANGLRLMADNAIDEIIEKMYD